MDKTSAAPQSTPHSLKGGDASKPIFEKSARQRSVFLVMVLHMTWQLALAVLVPVIAGVWLDNRFDTSFIIFIGLAVAFVASTLVMWRTMQKANRLPVPKLTEAQKHQIQKQYEEDDADV